jgi:hypothetical protein
MDPNLLYALVGFIAALSVASERLVDITKGFIPALNTKNINETQEAKRQTYIQLLAVICGIGTSLIAWPITHQILPLNYWPNWFVIVALGLLASGGSGFWNSIQSYLKLVKDLKSLAAKEEKQRLARTAQRSGD